MDAHEPEERSAGDSIEAGDIKDSRGVAIGRFARSTVFNLTYEDAPPMVVEEATKAAARQKLEELPLEEIADRASPPEGSRMPLRRNPIFVGREDELRALAASLKTEDAPAIAATTGLGGIGKTQLASEFVHRYGQYFWGGVYWLSFAEAGTVPAEVAECGRVGKMRLDLPDEFDALELQAQLRWVMSAWQSALPRLLVFDNCEEEELLDQWCPPIGGCRVLVTSRREWWHPTLGVEVVALDKLNRQESIALLRKHRSDLPAGDPDLDAIARELGDLPLALELAGSYLSQYHSTVTPGKYLAELRRPDLLGHSSLQAEGASYTTRRVQNVRRTFALSYERLNTREDLADTLAVALLARAARFAPDEPIPRTLLLSTVGLPDDDPGAAKRAEDGLRMLEELGLLKVQEAGALRLHRLLVDFVRNEVVDAEAQAAVEEALYRTVAPLLDEGYPAPVLALLPHLRVVTDAAKEREDEQAALLCYLLGRHLHMVGAYNEAQPLNEQALEIYRKMYGEEHPATADSLNNLAILLSDQGAYDEAKSLHEQALEIYRKVYGEEHPTTKQIRENLASLRTGETTSFIQRLLARIRR